MVVNALSYGTIIPLLYPYAARFGLEPFSLSMLFASFSLAQLIATPIIGRLSDQYGRKPLLLLCLAGTAVSQLLFASATSVVMLFVARILDGITGGNNSVAQAIIADTTSGPERAKAFGFLGATFGIGFLVGPALGGLLSQIGPSVPFYFSAFLAAVGTVIGMLTLKETLPPAVASEAKTKSAWAGLDLRFMVKALTIPATGTVLIIGFIVAIAQNTFVIGFQSFTNFVLAMSTFQIGLTFTLYGLINLLMQAVGIRFLMKVVPSKKRLITLSLWSSAVALILMSFPRTPAVFIPVSMLFGIAGGPLFALISGLVSERTTAEDQGAILGVNQSYISLGQVVGPLVAGLVASSISVPAVFVVSGLMFVGTALLGQRMYEPVKEKADI